MQRHFLQNLAEALHFTQSKFKTLIMAHQPLYDIAPNWPSDPFSHYPPPHSLCSSYTDLPASPSTWQTHSALGSFCLEHSAPGCLYDQFPHLFQVFAHLLNEPNPDRSSAPLGGLSLRLQPLPSLTSPPSLSYLLKRA